MLPVGQGSRLSNINNPLLSGLAPQQSTATHRGLPSGPPGQPIATSTPVGTPARSNMPSLPPSSISRPLSGSTLSATDGSTRYVPQKMPQKVQTSLPHFSPSCLFKIYMVHTARLVLQSGIVMLRTHNQHLVGQCVCKRGGKRNNCQ